MYEDAIFLAHIFDPAAMRNAADGDCTTGDFSGARSGRRAYHCGEPFRHAEVRPDRAATDSRSHRMWAVGSRSDRLRRGANWRRSGTVRLHCATSAIWARSGGLPRGARLQWALGGPCHGPADLQSAGSTTTAAPTALRRALFAAAAPGVEIPSL